MAEDQWSLKEYRPNNSPKRGFFRKNLAPAVKPQGAHSFIAYLTFHFVPGDESGLPSAEDSRLLAKLEGDAFVELEAGGLAVHVATVLKDGVKDLLFYTRDAEEFLKRAEKYRYLHDQFDVECEIGPDPDWKQYKDFPQ
jgi:hypothetical protein